MVANLPKDVREWVLWQRISRWLKLNCFDKDNFNLMLIYLPTGKKRSSKNMMAIYARLVEMAKLAQKMEHQGHIASPGESNPNDSFGQKKVKGI